MWTEQTFMVLGKIKSAPDFASILPFEGDKNVAWKKKRLNSSRLKKEELWRRERKNVEIRNRRSKREMKWSEMVGEVKMFDFLKLQMTEELKNSIVFEKKKLTVEAISECYHLYLEGVLWLGFLFIYLCVWISIFVECLAVH